MRSPFSWLRQELRIWKAQRRVSRRLAEELLVAEAAVAMRSISLSQQRRITQAYADESLTGLTPEEIAMGRNRIYAMASARSLAEAGLWDEQLLRQFAWTGYQELMAKTDPHLAFVSTSYRDGEITLDQFDEIRLWKSVTGLTAGDLRWLSLDALEAALPHSEFAERHPELSRRLLRAFVGKKSQFQNIRNQLSIRDKLGAVDEILRWEDDQGMLYRAS